MHDTLMIINERIDWIDSPISVCQNSLYKAPEERVQLIKKKVQKAIVGSIHT